ncbi:uncharacterized protein LOC116339364 [Contarinia nasturtii]|uniref:uncharacterized protein LOC116339364 n=1 Tax=Contarinia nasturtii TaxID=265458 RepID=UPI0012D3D262|nr:uncharacterized protein LOC116339364 [Contarinia nasturtii]
MSSFLHLLLLPLFIQSITTADPNNHITFFDLLEKFYVKGDRNHFPIRPKLDFMLTMPRNFYDVRPKLKAPVNEFLDSEIRDRVAKKIPKTIKINETNTRVAISSIIESINDQRIQIRNINADILKKMSFKPSEKNDDLFIQSYKAFKVNPFDLAHAQQVWRDQKTMRDEYDELHAKFNVNMNAAETVKASVDSDLDIATKGFFELLNMSEIKQVEKMCVTLESITNELIEQQQLVLGKLESVRETIEQYNIKRYRWAEFVIGMRYTVDSNDRHSVRRVKIKQEPSCSCIML